MVHLLHSSWSKPFPEHVVFTRLVDDEEHRVAIQEGDTQI